MKNRDFVLTDPMPVLTAPPLLMADHWKWRRLNGLAFMETPLSVSHCILNFLGQQSVYTLSHLLHVPTTPLLWSLKYNSMWQNNFYFLPHFLPAAQVTHSGVAGTGLTDEILWF